jgi:hypothetical protein
VVGEIAMVFSAPAFSAFSESLAGITFCSVKVLINVDFPSPDPPRNLVKSYLPTIMTEKDNPFDCFFLRVLIPVIATDFEEGLENG